MWTDAQRLYLEDVLGVSPESYRQVLPTTGNTAAAAPPKLIHAHVILSPALNEAEQDLLRKILASIQLGDLPIFDVLPDVLECQHVLAFNGSSGVTANGPVTHWGFSLVSQMVGSTAEVSAHKRETWAQLQKFRKVLDAGSR